ncbi:MAG: 3-hydroxyisobutyrate dehydrogenase-like beta-hydroxyacid dehydrogenase [Halocynthiibacter sp.]|jgi:3-hydroxyisobutyrate dehydrogenase-like beta-hydroxyacid dehydrogenase
MLDGVGLAGCGIMGAPMLASLLHEGIEARGFDIRPAGEFGLLAPHISNDPVGFATGLKTLLTVVRDIPQSDALLFGDQALSQARDLETIIICSTVSPRYIHDLRTRIPAHITLIDAPMSGAQIAAVEGRLSFMLGGEDAVLDHYQPLFAAMGAHFHRMGPLGAGMQAKVLNNLLAASNTAMTRLVLDWAKGAGLDRRALLDLFETSSGQNWLASGFDTIEFAKLGHTPDNTIAIIVKDVASALDAAPEGADIALPLAVQSAMRALTPFED